MRKIEYNISSGKSIDLKHFLITISMTFLISFFFLYIGIDNIIDTNLNLEEKVDQKKYYDTEHRKITENEKLFEERIEKIKITWNRQVTFANSVIDAKVFPFIKRLEYFEEILPDMVQLNEILIDSSKKGEIVVSVSSYSIEKLYELYRMLIRNNLVIASESENGGVYRSKLRVTLKK